MADEKKLQKEVGEKYQVLDGHGVGEYHFKGHVVHLDRLDLAQADKLVKKGLPYLVEKPKQAAAPKNTPEK